MFKGIEAGCPRKDIAYLEFAPLLVYLNSRGGQLHDDCLKALRVDDCQEIVHAAFMCHTIFRLVRLSCQHNKTLVAFQPIQ